MRFFRKVICFMLTIVLLIGCIPEISLQAKSTFKENQIKLAKTSNTLKIGGKTQIEVLNVDNNAIITYKNDDSRIASVTKKGSVTALQPGKTKIYVNVKSNGKNRKLTYIVTVKKPAISYKSATLLTGSKKSFTVKYLPKSSKCKWYSTDESLLKVSASGSRCTVKALKTGNTKLCVEIKIGKKTYKLSSTITIKKKKEESLKTYTVKFKPNGGDQIKEQSVKSGEYAAEPASPTRDGYKFTGWYSDSNCTKLFDFSKPINSNLTLYAGWKKEDAIGGGYVSVGSSDNTSIEEKPTDQEKPAEQKDFTVTFDVNTSKNIEVPKPQVVSSGAVATRPDDPIMEGYQFLGWFANKNEKDWTNTYKFDTPVTADITLYAFWVNLTKDTDLDGLSDELEAYLGTDKKKIDTDGDSLTDYQEVTILGTNPLKIDSDNNSVSDFDEDYDKDGITNGVEFELKTNPIVEDSDGDGLKDGDEVNLYSTSPIKRDTDDDGAEDGWEILNSFDPCAANATFDIAVKSEGVSDVNPVAASVELNVVGDQVVTLDVAPVSSYENPLISEAIPGYLGRAYDFSIDGGISSAELTFEYNTELGVIGDDFQPRIYYFNDETGCLEELENQTVVNGKVSAETTHFSTYILLNKVEFDKVWEAEIKPPAIDEEGNAESMDVVIVVDYSKSMNNNDPDQTFKILSKNFISKLRDNIDQAAIVKFIAKATLVQGLTTDKNSLNTAIDSIEYDDARGEYSGTNGSDGYHQALEQLKGSTAKSKYIIFITDGIDNHSSYRYDDLINESVEMGVTAYTIGMGFASDYTLQDLADGTGGKYYRATTDINMEDPKLDEVFEKIENETMELTIDSNSDGIPDFYNKMIKDGTLRLSNGSACFAGYDFNYDKDGNPSDDYDGDGLKNGEEILLMDGFAEGLGTYLYMASDPTLVHSDGDGMDDYTEVKQGTNPLKVEIAKEDIDELMDDEKYSYGQEVGVFDENFIKKADITALSAIYQVCNRKEIYRDMYINYFRDYCNSDYLAGLQEENAKMIMDETLYSIFAQLGGLALKAKDPVDVYNEMSTIKDLISEINGTPADHNIYDILTNQYKNVITRISAKYPQLSGVKLKTHTLRLDTVNRIKISEIGKSVGSTMETISNGLTCIGYGVDIVNTVWQIASVSANQQAFEHNLDILNELKNSTDDEHASAAANVIISSISSEYSRIIDEVLRDVDEIKADVIVTLASSNLYIMVIVAARDGVDILLGASDLLTEYYEMVSYKRLDAATKSLLNENLKVSGKYYQLDVDDVKNVNRYLVHLAQIRILGEKKYLDFKKLGGVIGFFTKPNELEEQISSKIAAIKQRIFKCNLQISRNL